MENKNIITKPEFIARYAKEQEITKKDAAIIYDTVFGLLSDVLAEGNGIAIPGLGKFEITEKGERTARNFQTGEKMTIPAHHALKFIPSSAIKEAIK